MVFSQKLQGAQTIKNVVTHIVSYLRKLSGQGGAVRDRYQGQGSLLLRVHHNLVQEFIENILSSNLRLPIEEGNLPGLRDL